jgi:hypothetical protein
MVKLNKTNFIIKPKRGVRANLVKVTNYFLEGEMIYTTDTKHLFIADANYIPQPVASLDMAIVNDDGEIITNGGEIVWLF